ncbi:transcription elongation factor GreA [Amnibacterium setariae]|jgi:transcription elongation factor GreA|uniref:Transcription elongation factor GreA n=1 Tax=Amnibacterium setariae TaxID=2306585 RepID=A0A3A1U3C4_9MICO|nr:transcription elongation factor GreA [Amnibacterium setariae]RIX30892.1 transcription elongation factor GreA [Amnibacterium setariae]
MSQTSSVTWLTQEAYDRLSAELEELSGPGRTEIAKRIEQAREEGDLKENGGYHAAKEEQGKIEARIRQLTQLLRTAEVGQPAGAGDEVAPGNVVTASVAGNEMRFLLGSREIAGDSGLDVYSEGSPLGAAIVGAKVGSTVSYTAPNGRAIEVKIVKVDPYEG